MSRALVLLAVAACGSSSGSGGDAVDATPPGPDAFENSICIDPSSVTMEPNLAFAGVVGCLDTGVRGGGACPGVVHAGLCPPNVSIKEVAVFVRDDATSEGYVVMRAPVTFHTEGTLDADGETVRDLPDNVDIGVESMRADGVRARIVFQLSATTVSVIELHHDAPL